MLQCQVLLWLDSKTVAPRRPFLFDMAHPQHKRYEVLLGMPDVGDIVVTSEKFGDDTIIAVLPKDAKMTKELLPATQQPPAQSTPADVVRGANALLLLRLLPTRSSIELRFVQLRGR